MAAHPGGYGNAEARASRHARVVALARQGKGPSAIAATLGVSVSSVARTTARLRAAAPQHAASSRAPRSTP